MQEGQLFRIEPVALPAKAGLSATTLGAIGETRAVVKLLELGHKVAIPVADDDGVDLVVDYRLRIQVKACSGQMTARSDGCPRPYYAFSMVGGRIGRRQWDQARSDFVCCHAISEERWWVIPSTAITSASLYIGRGGRFGGYLNAWDQLRQAAQ